MLVLRHLPQNGLPRRSIQTQLSNHTEWTSRASRPVRPSRAASSVRVDSKLHGPCRVLDERVIFGDDLHSYHHWLQVALISSVTLPHNGACVAVNSSSSTHLRSRLFWTFRSRLAHREPRPACPSRELVVMFPWENSTTEKSTRSSINTSPKRHDLVQSAPGRSNPPQTKLHRRDATSCGQLRWRTTS